MQLNIRRVIIHKGIIHRAITLKVITPKALTLTAHLSRVTKDKRDQRVGGDLLINIEVKLRVNRS